MNLTKAIAIKLAGFDAPAVMSPHEPTPQARFDRLWPSEQARLLKLAERIERIGK
jgi:hypothetical protein